MNKSGVKNYIGTGMRDILFATHPKHAMGVRVSAENVTLTNADGKKIIYAGQALGGTANPYDDRTAAIHLVTDATNAVYGVTQHDIVFDSDTDVENANLIDFGWINTANMDPLALPIPEAIVTALSGKVTFVNGK